MQLFVTGLETTGEKIDFRHTVSGKGVLPYEKINSINSLNSKPEYGIFFRKMNFSVLQKKSC